ncbi:MAG: DEAD/DEAH box helicase [Deltaproteobacteria bacterium]|nr:DEAD/DEAH box helicase [Deltaproteobacteria bacterium]
METKTFKELNLAEKVYRAVKAQKYEIPTPIQAEAIPHLLKGHDLIGCAQTGTGKTAAFALPILNQLSINRIKAKPRSARVLVLTPTRELAAQVSESFRTYGKFLGLSHALVYGGVKQHSQVKALSRGVDILIATPGRLLDLMRQGYLKLNQIEVFVLDEADRMLDMGFIPDIRKVISELPKKRQALLFSATMAPQIRQLAETLLNDPVKITVKSELVTAENIDERIHFVDDKDKRNLLSEVLGKPDVERALVFTKTKNGANRLAKHLGRRANAIHGNKSQSARLSALQDFRTGRCRVLVATDVASRGIDVTGITHVINYDLPREAESYVHRIGRTARAGASGSAISFCGVGDKLLLRNIERLLKRSVPKCDDHSFHSDLIAKAGIQPREGGRPRGRGAGRGRGPRRFGNRSRRA